MANEAQLYFNGKSLRLIQGNQVLFSVPARSGNPNFTGSDYFQTAYSPIPPSDQIMGKYHIDLKGYVPGIPDAMGDWYYHIEPDPILNLKDSTQRRSEIGLHADQNEETSPGTAGCIGVQKKYWNLVRTTLDALARSSQKYIRLTVNYTNEAFPTVSHWAEEAFNYLHDKGIVTEKRFSDTCTRGEMMAMLYNYMKYCEVIGNKEITFDARITIPAVEVK